MGFAEDVQAGSKTGSAVGHVVQALNVLSPRDRKAIVAYLDDPPPGAQRVVMGKELSKRAAKAGLEIKISGQQISSFIGGNRNGLLP